ncbi:N-acetylglucosamine-6-phosphate deacetylase [Streptococcus pacificus]|uniref:N-acetylglucosamine-6-phosphate deacetylase n=1 Tax=Streptococcus pacificus TaxID=2740577 RepID=A0ABS0ZGH6_9STRE|nr:N-acetylglucosamine-6-phosphate deacetylase [Streptococcus pacificus]MBJ8325132.1 N-acetylglucosamine-6-phosphate deacetylase [Streptococcus pacificus]
MTKYFKADSFFYPYEEKKGGYLTIVDGKFGDWVADVPANAEVVDYSGYSIAPGLFDSHVHGYHGSDVMDNTPESIETISKGLLSTGVTSFLPTTLTASFEELDDVCKTIASVKNKVSGSKIRGIYFEGPFFTEKFKGAQNPSYMRDPKIEEFDQWYESSEGLLHKIAIAPERDGVEEFVSHVVSKGAIVSLGHSDATYEDALHAVQAGASVWVHAYNGMRALNHREPGMVGAVYGIPNTYAELICDGYHVSPEACRILLDQKGPDHVALITDCMRAGGMPDGDYVLGEFPVIVENGTARLKDSGSLAGSILKLDDGVKNVVDWGLANRLEAIRMATFIPAVSCHLEDKCGQIKKGHDADFIILNQDMTLKATFLDGEKVFEN